MLNWNSYTHCRRRRFVLVLLGVHWLVIGAVPSKVQLLYPWHWVLIFTLVAFTVKSPVLFLWWQFCILRAQKWFCGPQKVHIVIWRFKMYHYISKNVPLGTELDSYSILFFWGCIVSLNIDWWTIMAVQTRGHQWWTAEMHSESVFGLLQFDKSNNLKSFLS